jgi:hypothetical protein
MNFRADGVFSDGALQHSIFLKMGVGVPGSLNSRSENFIGGNFFALRQAGNQRGSQPCAAVESTSTYPERLKLLERRTEAHRPLIAVHLGVSTRAGARSMGKPPKWRSMKLKDQLKPFGKYLNGNPAMQEIWSDAIDRIENDLPVAPVQAVVVREWLSRAGARRNELELQAQRDMLSDEDYAELAALRDSIGLIANFKESDK